MQNAQLSIKITEDQKLNSTFPSTINSNTTLEQGLNHKENSASLLRRKYVPKPKPKQPLTSPSPMILCTNHIPSLEDECQVFFNLEKPKNPIDSADEYDSEELANDMLSALPLQNLKEKEKKSIYEGKMSKDAEEILARKSSKLIVNSIEKIEKEEDDTKLVSRHTVNVLANTNQTVYSILKYMEMTIQDKEARRARASPLSKAQKKVINS